MFPAEPVAWLLLLAALPGWVYTRVLEARAPRAERSALDEFLGYLSVGLGATFVGVTVVALLGELPWRVFDFHDLVNSPDRAGYVAQNATAFLLAVCIAEAIAVLCAGLLARAMSRKTSDAIVPGGTARGTLFSRRPKGTTPYLAIELVDGRVLHGFLATYDMNPADGEIGLQAPVFVQGDSEASRTPTNLGGALVPSGQIRLVTFSHAPPPVEPRRGKGSGAPRLSAPDKAVSSGLVEGGL